jgi:hypothetical protein
MPGWGWVLLGVAVVAIVILAVLLVVAQRKTTALRNRFGAEYDRTVAATGQKRAAEAELAERQERRDKLSIRPLSQAASLRYQDEWRTVQSQFVDDPTGAVGAADRLIQSVMREQGYPVEDFDQRADDLSVDYPEVVENYRQGHRLATTSADSDQSSTEALRRAMRHYRALFEELVEAPGTDDGGSMATAPSDLDDTSVR